MAQDNDEQLLPLIDRSSPDQQQFGTSSSSLADYGAATAIARASSSGGTIGRCNARSIGRNQTQINDDDQQHDDTKSASPSANNHLQTFTAGEDPHRLAAAAREMGLARRRNPRRPVRGRDYDSRAAEFFGETFGRIVFEEEKGGHDFWETVAGVAGNVLVSTVLLCLCLALVRVIMFG